MEWFISDTHFGHTNIIKYCNRPFSSVDEMDREIVKNWNSRVKPKDKVWHLGDVGFYRKEKMASIINQLNGDKYLVLGNHDKRRSKDWWKDVGFVEVYSGPIERTPFLLSHKPVDVDDKVNICGHVHNTVELLYKNCLNVCVEPRDYKPISYAEICCLYLSNKKIPNPREAKLDNF